MFIGEFKEKSTYTRFSKNGKEHAYERYKTYCSFRCDACNTEFVRERGKMDPNRLNNNVFHVCTNCDAKKFAQRKGVERRQIWNLPASSDLDISKL